MEAGKNDRALRRSTPENMYNTGTFGRRGNVALEKFLMRDCLTCNWGIRFEVGRRVMKRFAASTKSHVAGIILAAMLRRCDMLVVGEGPDVGWVVGCFERRELRWPSKALESQQAK